VTRLLLFAALAVSLLVPVGALAVLAGVDPNPSSPSELEKDEMIDLYNELTRVEELARPGSAGHIAEARRIANEAAGWAERHEAGPEWEEFASATSALAGLLAEGIAGSPSFSETEYDWAVDRINTALAALPPERRPY
jgi:hypothetical protein